MSPVKVILLESDSESGSDLDTYFSASSQESFSGDEEFFALVATLSLTEDNPSAPPSPPASPPPPPAPPVVPAVAPVPAAAPVPAPPPLAARVPADSTLYSMSQNGQNRITAHWSEASASQSSGQVHTLQRRRKDRKLKKPVIVVFVGLKPGVYSNWNIAKVHCDGVSCCIYQGYVSLAAGRHAFQYASAHHMVLTVQRGDMALFLETRRQLISSSTFPLPGVLSSNPLNEGLDRDAWFCVYVGVSPGIYRTQLECAWNTVAIPGACFESWQSVSKARSEFDIAMQAGRVSVKML